MLCPPLSEDLLTLDGYATKAMAAKARANPDIVNLAFGEPDFGPPPTSRAEIEAHDLTWDAFLSSSKSYEQNRGMPSLRVAIADYYRRRYGLRVDPDRELLITHGGVEAIALAFLATSSPGDTIALTDPTYMLYQRAIRTLGRVPFCLTRPVGGNEYDRLFGEAAAVVPKRPRALMINSPENPSGYVASLDDFSAIARFADQHNAWIIHDEVYDSMAFARPHLPARKVAGLENRSILINSFSKKYGVPGLRIGWLCAPPEVIDLAAKLHDYLYLGVNILSERFALRMISDLQADAWMDSTAESLAARALRLQQVMTAEKGFAWPRPPQGGMFAFPDISSLAARLKANDYQAPDVGGNGALVAQFLMDERLLATIPGHVYGPSCQNAVRMILCSGDTAFERGTTILNQL